MKPFNATTRQAFNSHTADEWDAVFRVEVAGVSHAVFASYNGQGEWSQWGAPREALAANVETVTAWARDLFENCRDDAIRMAELEAERDSWVIGAPDGTETPDPDGWERDNPEEAAELAALLKRKG